MGYGINGGLRAHERSGDLGSRHDAGPQQPRCRTRNSSARKSQPGLDPDNPGAARDTMRGHQRLAGLGRPVSDPVWDDASAGICRLLPVDGTASGANRSGSEPDCDAVSARAAPLDRVPCRTRRRCPALWSKNQAASSTLFAAIFCASVRAVTEPATRANSPPCWTNGIVRMKRSARSSFRLGSRRAAVSNTYTKPGTTATATSPSGARRAPAAADVYIDDDSHQNQDLWNGGLGAPLLPATVNSRRNTKSRYYPAFPG